MQSSIALRLVEQGMRVFDREHHEIGKVDWVQFGEDDPEAPELEQDEPLERDSHGSVIDLIARTFRSHELPAELKERLFHEGFVRIGSEGLFAADRYVMPEQIESVSDEGLTLNVMRDELVKRH